MPRPPDVPDPRDPNAPLRAYSTEDQARSRITVGELLAGEPPSRVGEDLPAEPIDLSDIDPARLASLRRARDRILAELRRRRADGDYLGGER
jgi:hypothetical protein